MSDLLRLIFDILNGAVYVKLRLQAVHGAVRVQFGTNCTLGMVQFGCSLCQTAPKLHHAHIL